MKLRKDRAIRLSRATVSLGPGDRKLEQRIAALEVQTYELAKGFEEFLAEHQAVIDNLLDQQAECNLRLLFIMQYFKFGKTIPSPIIGAEPTTIKTTLYDIFMEQREPFEQALHKRIADERDKIEQLRAKADDERARGIIPSEEPAPAQSGGAGGGGVIDERFRAPAGSPPLARGSKTVS